MSIEKIREVFLWCAILNYSVIFLWYGIFTLAHDDLYRVVNRAFGRGVHLSVEQMDTFHLGGMMLYKIAVLVFVLFPCIALYIVH